ncbi:hypothetical protein, partial [Plasmodium yoelii yoelii]
MLIFILIKKINIFFIFYNNIYSNSDNISKFYNTHLVLKISYFFTKLKNEIINIKFRDTTLIEDYPFHNDNFDIVFTRCNCFMHELRWNQNKRSGKYFKNEKTLKCGKIECVMTKWEDIINNFGKKKKKNLIKIDEINIK